MVRRERERRGGKSPLAGTNTRFSFTDWLRPGFPDGLALHFGSQQIRMDRALGGGGENFSIEYEDQVRHI